MLLKVDCFDIDELVINGMSGCNSNNYKLKNNSVFSYSKYFLFWVLSNLDHK